MLGYVASRRPLNSKDLSMSISEGICIQVASDPSVAGIPSISQLPISMTHSQKLEPLLVFFGSDLEASMCMFFLIRFCSVPIMLTYELLQQICVLVFGMTSKICRNLYPTQPSSPRTVYTLLVDF